MIRTADWEILEVCDPWGHDPTRALEYGVRVKADGAWAWVGSRETLAGAEALVAESLAVATVPDSEDHLEVLREDVEGFDDES